MFGIVLMVMLVGCGPDIPDDPYDACVAMWEEVCACNSDISCTGYDQQCGEWADVHAIDFWKCTIKEADKCPDSIAIDGDIAGIFATCEE